MYPGTDDFSERGTLGNGRERKRILAYGNPVVILCDAGFKLIAIAWPLAERTMRATGQGDEADAIIRQVAEQYRQEQEGIHL